MPQLRALDIVIGRLQQLQDDVLDVLADVAGFGQRRCVHHRERHCADGHVRLTGFGIASRLSRERQAPEPPETIAGTLAYIAPEQTGRMNRSIDARSDLYALGV